MPGHARALLKGASRLALVLAYALLAFAAIDLGYRVHSHRPVLVLDDWRLARIQYLLFGERGMFHPVLGWVPRDEGERQVYNTLRFGVRRNFDEKGIRTGGILAVGDVFTDGGTEVEDGETWPANLERLIDAPVINAGVAGYAVDQIALRAEQLLPLVRPKTLVVQLSEEAIARAGLSSFGRSKPYFSLDGDRLVYHPPVDAAAGADGVSGWRAKARTVLGHSAVLDVVLSRLAPVYWLGKSVEPITQQADNDPWAIGCALLQRLKRSAEQNGAHLLVFLQHQQRTVAEQAEPAGDARKLSACAGAAGIEVVDQFQSLRAVVVADAGAFGHLYVQGDGLGEMSSAGNRRTAELLARALNN
ncbi:MAG: hypothetical protein J2P50_18200 [Hyphomicrobiaceae bacterium]|nr:hypothetical protein [Hyphomicrobiaceae bacterium]